MRPPPPLAESFENFDGSRLAEKWRLPGTMRTKTWKGVRLGRVKESRFGFGVQWEDPGIFLLLGQIDLLSKESLSSGV